MISSWLSDNPLAVLALLLGMPDLVGLLVAGVLIGPHGLQWLNPSQPTVQLLSDGGVIYLLFLAGLEIDLAEFARIRQRSLRFGLLTFALPMLGGLLLGLGYPIVRSYGAMREEAVTVAIGGTIVTDIAALVVLVITRLGRSLVQRSVNNDSQLFVAVLLAVFLAALAAELAGVEKIVGAFLAGRAGALAVW